jgi:T5SS/PEP-CTERM-associated repeat protein
VLAFGAITDYGFIYAGFQSDGTLEITSGDYAKHQLFSGFGPTDAPKDGTITLTGDETNVTIGWPENPGSWGSVWVGVSNPGGSGSLEILDGATLTSINTGYYDPVTHRVVGGYQNVIIGFNTGGSGSVTVDGEGSKLLAYGVSPKISVGRLNATGELTISDGGYALALIADVGRQDAVGHLTIDGEGSLLRLNDDAGTFGVPAYTGEAGLIRFGRDGGTGYLTISNGGQLLVENTDGLTDWPLVRFGHDNGSYGFGLVTGDGSSIDVIQHGVGGDDYFAGAWLNVGDGGQGVLTVADNAQVNVLGHGAFLSVADGRGISTTAQSQLIIESGADVLVDSQGYTGASMIIGKAAGTNGAATVDGAGSTLTVTSSALPPHATAGELIVGEFGTGILEISNGGQVVNSAHNGITQIAAKAGSTGLVTVDGATSLLDAGDLLAIGADVDAMTLDVLPDAGGDGTLMLVNGGHAMADDVFVGATGAITGDGMVTGNVTLLGGTLSPGTSAGEIVIDGKLEADENATILFEMDSFTPGQFDHVVVSQVAKIDLRAIEIDFPAAIAAAGSTATLLSASSVEIDNLTTENLVTDLFGGVPAEGVSTLGGNVQAYLLADTGPDLVVEALAFDGANPTGAFDFGTSETDGVDLTTVNGFGTGTGGGFDAFALFGVTAISGTAGADTIAMATTSAVTIDGRGGDDTLSGGSGDDMLLGGAGKNLLFGGDGADTFILSDDAVFDTIGDMVIGDDLIDVSDWGVTAFEDLTISEKGNGTIVIKAGGNSVRLLDEDDTLDPNALMADSFIFAVA